MVNTAIAGISIIIIRFNSFTFSCTCSDGGDDQNCAYMHPVWRGGWMESGCSVAKEEIG